MAKRNRNQNNQQKPVTQKTAPEQEVVEETVAAESQEEESEDQENESSEESGDTEQTSEGEAVPEQEDSNPDAPEEEKQEITTPSDVVAAPEVISDDVTQQAPQAPEPEVVDPALTSTVEEQESEDVSALDPSEDDDENVSTLKVQLAAFRKLVNGHGKDPVDFRAAAKMSSTITKFVIAHPKKKVLDTLLDFFVEEKNGVCSAENYMKGSTTLPANEEQQVGYLYGLFSDLANKRIVSINSSVVINILRKPEIVGYYNKKIAGFKSAQG